MDQNRKFAEMNGLCWHEYDIDEDKGIYFCTKCNGRLSQISNPDFSDPREVLKVVMRREDWPKFLNETGVGIWEEADHSVGIGENILIDVDYITTPGKLRDAWIEWKETT
jgi:hypothetical protein